MEVSELLTCWKISKNMQTNCILSALMNTHLPRYLTDSPVGLWLLLLTQDLIINCLNIFFSVGTARSATAWPPVNCACVLQLFQQLINTMLCPAFRRKLICQPLCYAPFRIQICLSKSCPRRWIPCSLLTNAAMTSALPNSRYHKLIAKVNKWKNSDMENFICNQYGKRIAILNTKNTKMCGWTTKLETIKNAICMCFLSHLQKIRIFNFPK